jgi:serine/threonine protein phosphatase PrpC
MPLASKKNKIIAFWQSWVFPRQALKYELETYADQLIGRRDSQQDRFDVFSNIKLPDGRDGTLMLVADGMGGHACGAQASQLIVDSFRQVFAHGAASIKQLFTDALSQANHRIACHLAANPHCKGMGSTVVAALLCERELYWFSIGDSPLWLIRKEKLLRLNADHSMLPVLLQMAQMGEMSHEDVYRDPNRHALRSVIQGSPVKLIDSSETPFAITPDDIIILASDGLQTLSEPTLTKISGTASVRSCKSTVFSLLREIKEHNNSGQDNTTVIIAKLMPVTNTPQSAS